MGENREAFRSSLNPDAPAFVPKAFNAGAGDWSPPRQWWEMVEAKPEYCCEGGGAQARHQLDEEISLPDDLFDSFDSLWESNQQSAQPKKHANYTEPAVSNRVEMLAFMASMNSISPSEFRAPTKVPKQEVAARIAQQNKPQQIVSAASLNKFAKRRIQQPRS